MADDVLVVSMVEWTWRGYKRWPRVFAIVARALVPSISALRPDWSNIWDESGLEPLVRIINLEKDTHDL